MESEITLRGCYCLAVAPPPATRIAISARATSVVSDNGTIGRQWLRDATADDNGGFKDTITRHEQFVLAQAQQGAACNAIHTLEARLARWLLQCRDLLRNDDIALTQEFLAEMLGVRRTSVTLTASALQHAGLIRYRRGHIRVLDAEGLKGSACECYETLKLQGHRLLGLSD